MMWTRKPLPAHVEVALNTLDKTAIFAEGEAAKEVAAHHFRKLQWSKWLWMPPFLCMQALSASEYSSWVSPVFALLSIMLIACVVYAQYRHYTLSLDIYESAMNRWRQIAGTLAVSGKTQ